MSGAAVRQLVVFQSRPVSRLRYTQLGVLARPLTRTSLRGGSRVGASCFFYSATQGSVLPLCVSGRIHFNSAIASMAAAGRWRSALALLQQMREAGSTPDLVTFNAVITAFEKVSRRAGREGAEGAEGVEEVKRGRWRFRGEDDRTTQSDPTHQLAQPPLKDPLQHQHQHTSIVGWCVTERMAGGVQR